MYLTVPAGLISRRLLRRSFRSASFQDDDRRLPSRSARAVEAAHTRADACDAAGLQRKKENRFTVDLERISRRRTPGWRSSATFNVSEALPAPASPRAHLPPRQQRFPLTPPATTSEQHISDLSITPFCNHRFGMPTHARKENYALILLPPLSFILKPVGCATSALFNPSCCCVDGWQTGMTFTKVPIPTPFSQLVVIRRSGPGTDADRRAIGTYYSEIVPIATSLTAPGSTRDHLAPAAIIL